jgi:hypothetical protein
MKYSDFVQIFRFLILAIILIWNAPEGQEYIVATISACSFAIILVAQSIKNHLDKNNP